MTPRRFVFQLAPLATALFVATSASAGDALVIGAASVDPPTVVTLGVQLLVSGDDNHNAKVDVRYRKQGASTWQTGLSLFRVHPTVVTGFSVPDQFAGSIFDLLPGTAYEIELHATDADGAVDQVIPLMGSTRAVPADPKAPNAKNVTDAASLSAALAAAQPGDVITLADATYQGNFQIDASGTADNPIVIRGTTQDGSILDGGGCMGCNVLEVYGSFVHVERLTIQAASRALRFQGAGSDGNVVRRVHIKDTILGIGSKQDQKNFYICDNILEGRLSWPSVYTDDGGAHANDDGINVEGDGHVVCHNKIHGYGDAMKVEQDGARSDDFYGNEVTSAYDNGLELDAMQRNGRCFRNRFTNTYATLSFQPIFGGPVYAFRNILVNVANEQLKFHALGTQPPEEPSGMFVVHNTFVSPAHALSLQTSAASHYFTIANNLFVGPAAPDQGKTVDWTGPIDQGTFDYDGYTPDGVFAFNLPPGGHTKFPSFAAAQAAGLEAHGLLLTAPIFQSGLAPPAAYTMELMPPDASLAAGSNAIDKGVVMPNLNDGFLGKAPDLGALESGCAVPIYGPRPDGMDESNEPIGCSMSTGSGGGGGGAPTSSVTGASNASSGETSGAGGSGSGDSGQSSGCGCEVTGAETGYGAGLALALVSGLNLARRRRRLAR